MKILHFIEEYPKISESFIPYLINNFSEHENLLITNLISNDVTNSKFKIINVKLSRPVRKFLKGLRWLFNVNISTINVKKLLSTYKQFQPNCIHIHFGWSIRDAWPLLSFIHKSNNNIPIVISFHGSDVFNTPLRYPYYITLIQRLSNRENVTFITPSSFLKHELLALINNSSAKVSIIGNIFNPVFLNSPANFPDHSHTYNILSIGRLIPLKGHKLLIYAFSDFIKRRSVDAKLIIIGDGEERENLSRLIGILNLSEKVTLTGALDHSQIPEYVFSSNLFIQPSITHQITGAAESFGITILEAIAASLPVIVSNSGGMSEIVQGSDEFTSRIVNENNIKELSSAIEYFYNKNTPISLDAQNKILEKYELKIIIKQYNKIFSSRNSN